MLNESYDQPFYMDNRMKRMPVFSEKGLHFFYNLLDKSHPCTYKNWQGIKGFISLNLFRIFYFLVSRNPCVIIRPTLTLNNADRFFPLKNHYIQSPCSVRCIGGISRYLKACIKLMMPKCHPKRCLNFCFTMLFRIFYFFTHIERIAYSSRKVKLFYPPIPPCIIIY